jgi:hypothetical protein
MCVCPHRYGMILADNGGSWYFQGEAASPEDWSALVRLDGQPSASAEEKMNAFHVSRRGWAACRAPGQSVRAGAAAASIIECVAAACC